jgi:hypothetical protein
MSAPRDLVLIGKDTQTIRGVRTVVGRLNGVRGDTMTIVVSESDGLDGRQTFASGQHTATIVETSGVDVTVLSTNPRRRQWAVIGGIFAGVAFIAGTLFAMRGMT